MKKSTVFITGLFFVFTLTTQAQDWVKLMFDKNVNVHEVQKAFYKWYNTAESSKNLPEHESSYELFKRWENLMVPRTYPSGNRNDMPKLLNDYFVYKNNELKNPSHTMSSPANWTYAGATGVPINYGGDGRINRIRFYPGNTNIIYACAPNGGLWKSTNAGATWATNTDQLTTIGTSDIAIDHTNPAIMYLAMGDGDAEDAFTTGVLKSTDTGKTWNTTGLSYSLQNSGPHGYEGNQLLINPDSTNVIFAAMSFGIYRSRDYGSTWVQVLNTDIRSLEFEPFHTNVVYAASQWGTFFRSTNGGFTFTQVTNGLPNTDVARMTVGVSPADSNRVYILVDENNQARFYGLYMSTDRGQTFSTQSSFTGGAPNLLGWSNVGADSSGQGWYTLPLAVSPTNADTILVGGVNIWMSGDKGITWKLNAEQGGNGAPYVHADIHHILFYPGSGSSYIAGCDGGVFVTNNKGSAWTNISNNLEIGQLYTIGLSALTPGYSISGWQDNGSNLSGATWIHTAGGDGETSFIDYSNDANLFSSYQNGSLIYSTDSGANWNGAVGNITESGAWTTPWLQDPYKPNKSYVFSGFENLWYAKSPTFNWVKLSSWGVAGEHINAIAVYPGNDNYIYVIRNDSIFATTNKGNSWTVINGSLPLSGYSASAITVDPKTSTRIWVTLSGWGANNKVYQSENGGHTWTNISTGLPNLPVNCIICQPNTPEGIYIGTDIGIYYHDTALKAWVDFSAGLPNVSVTDLKIQAPNTLVASTFGRGVWKTGTYINTAVDNITTEIEADIYPNPTSGNVTLSLKGAAPGDYTITVINLLGQIIYSEKVNIMGNFTKNLNLATYKKGLYLIRIEGSNTETVKKIIVQ